MVVDRRGRARRRSRRRPRAGPAQGRHRGSTDRLESCRCGEGTMNMRAFSSILLSLGLFATGCASNETPATAIAMSVQSDLQLRAELATVEYRVAPVDGDLAQPTARFTA